MAPIEGNKKESSIVENLYKRQVTRCLAKGKKQPIYNIKKEKNMEEQQNSLRKVFTGIFLEATSQ